jgi:YVTN family beta-propeller protein
MRLFTTVTVGLSALLVRSAAVAPTPSPALLVLAKTDRMLYIVDPATNAIAGQVPSGLDPHEVVASTDGKFAYISNYGGGSFTTITVVDLVAQRAAPTIELGALAGPHGLVFVAGKLWFTAEGSKVIGSYDPVTSKIDWVLGTGQNRTHMLDVSADAKRIVTTNVSSATVTIAEKTTARQGGPPGGPPGGAPPGQGAPPQGGPPQGMPNGPPGGGPGGPPRADWTETVVPVGNGAEGFDVTPDRKSAWVANAQDGTISIVDLGTKRVTQTLTVDVRGANRLKFTPDGTRAFVSTLGGPNVTVLDVATRAVIKRIPVGRGAAGMQLQPDGARLYVACTPDDYVAVIDVKTLAVVGKITAGKQPDGLAWAVRP